jgi:hypothetical protein
VTSPSIADAQADDGTMYCYRHPDREVWIRCGRCDRPICTQCAMQGPVGFRCKQCGKLAFDPLTSFTPRQLLLGSATAILAGVAAGFIGARIGLLSIFVAYFAGGLIAEAITRVTGYKRGPVMFAIVFGGLALGTLIGAGVAFWIDYSAILRYADADVPFPLDSMLLDAATWALITAGAAAVGAWSRLR